MNRLTYIFCAFFVFLFSSCSSQQTAASNPDEGVIYIINGAFVPESVTVSPGDVVFFYNQDSIAHKIASQSADNQFDSTSDFESLVLASDQINSITISEDATPGTTFHFYDEFLTDLMVTPNGSINIE